MSVGDDVSSGLSSELASQKLIEFGRNEIPPKVKPIWKMVAEQFYGAMPFMLIAAVVIAAAVEDWVDFGLILAILIINSALGFYESKKAADAVGSLQDSLVHEVSVKRNGSFVNLDTTLLVPGDFLFLKGGLVMPADCEWVSGDVMLVDQAALTGESLPVRRGGDVPDEDGHPGSGKLLLSGAILKQGECYAVVVKTGFNTMIGEAAAALNESSEDGEANGIFYNKILKAIFIFVGITILDVIILIIILTVVRDWPADHALLDVIAIVVASIPVALPLVMQVTLAVGAKTLASEQAIVTHLAALDEIAAMKSLCSDKTGTLTTAKMSVYMDKIWVNPKSDLKPKDVMKYCALASNRHNSDDAIDSAVFRAFDESFPNAKEIESQFRVEKFIGFNAIVKRVVVYLSSSTEGEIKLGKGLISKVLSTGNDGGDEWICRDIEELRPQIESVDIDFSTAGFKTIGVCRQILPDGEMEFLGIVPMLDPPRMDTKETIAKIRRSGQNVKMITGDHLNIAKELARQIDLGTNILPNTDLWPASVERDERIVTADGFAQVLPKDKHEVVTCLQRRGYVTGMTGDGVNDAPALSAANIGIAVADATDAARCAADIILTEPGLSPIFTAVLESRKIFARIRSYVYYRLAATVAVVLYLSVLLYAYEMDIYSLYIIILALLNDLTTVTIAYDYATPSPLPVEPNVRDPLVVAMFLGVFQFVQSFVFYLAYFEDDSQVVCATEKLLRESGCKQIQSILFLQMFIAIELMIFSTRTPKFFFSTMPNPWLLTSVVFSLIVITVFVGTGVIFEEADWSDIGRAWWYSLVWFIGLDLLKIILLHYLNGETFTSVYDLLLSTGESLTDIVDSGIELKRASTVLDIPSISHSQSNVSVLSISRMTSGYLLPTNPGIMAQRTLHKKRVQNEFEAFDRSNSLDFADV